MQIQTNELREAALQTPFRMCSYLALVLAVAVGAACDDGEPLENSALAERGAVDDVTLFAAAPESGGRAGEITTSNVSAGALGPHGIHALRVGAGTGDEVRIDLLDEEARPIGLLIYEGEENDKHIQFSWQGAEYDVLSDGSRSEITIDGVPAREAFGRTGTSSALPGELAPVLDLAASIVLEAGLGQRPEVVDTLTHDAPATTGSSHPITLTSEVVSAQGDACSYCADSNYCFFAYWPHRARVYGKIGANNACVPNNIYWDWDCTCGNG